MALIRWAIVGVVVVGVGRRVWLEHEKLAAYSEVPHPGWLALGVVGYLFGLAPCAGFWWLAMRDRGTRPNWITTLAAYFAGHLGKYVPGKGLVVVIRAGMMRDSGVAVATGAITCVHETVLMMATGSLVAAAIMPAVELPHRAYLMGIAAVLSVVLGVLALPPIAMRLGKLATRPFPNVASEESQACQWSTVAVGSALIAGGWLMMGLSLAAVLAAMRQWAGLEAHYGLLPALGLMTIVVALATVGGFVSLTPGGLGSREWILVETLGPVIGADHAVVAAVLLRVVWIAAEAAGTALFWFLDKQCKKLRAASN